jgi:hypothetical protein
LNKAKLYKLINSLLSILIAITAIYYLVGLIQDKEMDLAETVSQILESRLSIIVVVLLMPINWLLETLKWRSIVDPIQKINFIKSVKSIFAGILLSLFTPNRIGELGGRLLYIKKENRSTVLYLNSICSISQLMITVLIGIWSILYLKDFLTDWIDMEESILIVIDSTFTILILLVYFSSKQLGKLFDFFSKKKEEKSNKRVNKRIRFRLLTLSLARYAVFCIQFYLVIQIFESTITIQLSTAAIALVFFLTAVVPTGFISDLPVRTSIAFIIFEFIGFNGVSGLSASILLWIINLILPALISLYFLRKIDWMGKLNWKAG